MSMNNHSALKNFKLSVVTAQGSVFQGQVYRVIVPAEAGEMCVFSGHTPVLAKLVPGEARYLVDEAWEYLYLEGGFVEIQPTEVTVLADTVKRSNEIDATSAEEAVKRALKQDSMARLPYDKQLAHAELIRALALLKVVRNAKKFK